MPANARNDHKKVLGRMVARISFCLRILFMFVYASLRLYLIEFVTRTDYSPVQLKPGMGRNAASVYRSGLYQCKDGEYVHPNHYHTRNAREKRYSCWVLSQSTYS